MELSSSLKTYTISVSTSFCLYIDEIFKIHNGKMGCFLKCSYFFQITRRFIAVYALLVDEIFNFLFQLSCVNF